MCLSAQAIAAFLNLLNPEIVSTAPGVITVRAEVATTRYILVGETGALPAPPRPRRASLPSVNPPKLHLAKNIPGARGGAPTASEASALVQPGVQGIT